MKKPFCLYLKNQVRVDYNQVTPCCWITKKFDLLNGNKEEFDNYQMWLDQIDDWVPECDFCQEKEVRGVESPRQHIEKNPKAIGIFNSDEINKNTSLEFQIDSNCNAACLMCGPYASTTWQKYNIGGITDKSESNKKIDLDTNYFTELRYNKIHKFIKLDNVNLVVFLGGEPMYNNFHKKVLTDIQKSKPLNQLAARYVTNGSHRPDDKTVELWRQLKDLHIVFSIDGINEHFNYLRWPLQWDQVESNIKYFIDLKIPTMRVGISSAISPLNILYYDRYLAWEKEFFNLGPDSWSKFSNAFDAVNIINTAAIPLPLQDAVREKYPTLPWLVNRMRPFDQSKFNEFVKYIELHDSKRKLNWRETFPEIVQYFP